MIIKGIELSPFAGTKHRSVAFKPGLNVLLGPNEAGKSTLFKAIRAVLFTPTKLTKTRLDKELGTLFPANGSDTIRVHAWFESEGKTLDLSKAWGANKTSLLKFNNTEITDDEAIEAALKQISRIDQGTFDHVLFTHQSQLSNTIAQLETHSGTLHQLSDILRSNIIAQSGISADVVKENILKKIAQYYGNWDRVLDLPEKNRDINNKFTRGNGHILEAYYAYREVEKAYLKAVETDKALDAISLKMTPLIEQWQKVVGFKNEHSDKEKSVRDLLQVQSQKEKLTLEIQQLQTIHTQWPVLVEKTKLIEGNILQNQKHLTALQQEASIAESFEKLASAVKRHEQYVQHQASIDALSAQLKALPKVESKNIAELRAIEKTMHENLILLEARKLDVTIQASTGVEAFINGAKHTLNEKEPLTQSIAGNAHIKTDQLDITVTISGKDSSSIQQTLAQAQEARTALLGSLKAASLSEVEHMLLDRNRIEQEILQLEKAKNTLLEGNTLEHLQAQIVKAKETPSTRPLSVLRPLIQESHTQIELDKRELAQTIQQTHSFVQHHTSVDALTNRIFDLRFQLKELEQKQFSSLPEGFSDPNVFLDTLALSRTQADEYQLQYQQLKQEQDEIRLNAPNSSAEELKIEFEESKERFVKTLKEGKAYLKIQEKLSALLEKLEEKTYTPLYQNISQYLSLITNGKYSSSQWNGALPTKLGQNQEWIDREVLSEGTKDSLALAVRLGMAGYYLNEQTGFLLLDDPLVNMDPERQKRAASCLQSFANEHQLILFTCHPSHAALVGGHVIELA